MLKFDTEDPSVVVVVVVVDVVIANVVVVVSLPVVADFLAALSSSRSDVVTQFVRTFVSSS